MTKVIKRAPGLSDTAVGDVPPRRVSVIKSGVADARGEAQSIRDRAEADAEEIRRSAAQEAEQQKEQARRQGYAEGRDQGAAELVAVVARASGRLASIEQQAVAQLGDLAVSIARKILGKELALRPEAVVDLVKQALGDKARQRREIVLRVHPDDLASLRLHEPELVEVLSRAKEIGMREDPEVARHGVVIETEAGTIDAQLETQLAALQRVLEEAR